MKENFSGLSQREASQRLKKFGYNEIEDVNANTPFNILLQQIKKNFMVYLLFISAILSFLIGKIVTGYALLVIIFILVVVGFLQEYKAERAIKALKKIIAHTSVVIRDQKEVEIPSREIVPGDIVILRTGEKVPADCLVLKEKDLRVDESVLTGESKEVKKFRSKTEKNYKRENQVFMGTLVVSGKCVAKVLHTGMNTEFGKIAGMISKAEKELPLQRKVNQIAKYMAFVAITVSILTGLMMLVRTPLSYHTLVDIFIVVIALSVSAFPEGLPVVLISVLSSGTYKMAKKNAIIKRMSVIDTLGETTVICTDKTGTITKGEMTAKKIFCDGRLIEVTGGGYDANGKLVQNKKKINLNLKENLPIKLLLKTAILCNDAEIRRRGTDSKYDIIGTPTEASLLIMGAKAGMFREDLVFTREEEIPFSSERKMMSVLCKEKDGMYVYSKGALEVLMDKCRYIQRDGEIFELDEEEKKKILDIHQKFAMEKMRILAFAYKKVPFFDKEHFERDMIFLGLVGLVDPPREEVKDAILSCKESGIRVKMITGDNKETAVEIAKEIGLEGEAVTGEDLDRITDDELSKMIDNITLFVRVRPEHKLRIVRVLKSKGEIVTMTGDGINDAPALKEAHIGVAMGIKGTDVSREAADMILKDDNFATIVSAIREGRTIFKNIQKVVTYQLSVNSAELFIIFSAILFGLPLPLLALQILFVNVVTDDLISISLGFNPPPPNIMKMKPRKKSEILNKQLIILLGITGAIIGIGTLGVFYFTYISVLSQGISEDSATATARTTSMITLVLFEIANAFNFRSLKYPVFKSSLFGNKYLVYASCLSILTTLIVIYTPLNHILKTTPLNVYNILLVVATSLSVIVICDIFKILNKNKNFFKYRL